MTQSDDLIPGPGGSLTLAQQRTLSQRSAADAEPAHTIGLIQQQINAEIAITEQAIAQFSANSSEDVPLPTLNPAASYQSYLRGLHYTLSVIAATQRPA